MLEGVVQALRNGTELVLPADDAVSMQAEAIPIKRTARSSSSTPMVSMLTRGFMRRSASGGLRFGPQPQAPGEGHVRPRALPGVGRERSRGGPAILVGVVRLPARRQARHSVTLRMQVAFETAGEQIDGTWRAAAGARCRSVAT